MTINMETEQYQKPGAGLVTAGVATGLVTSKAVTLPHQFFAKNVIEKMKNLNGKLSADEFLQIEKAVEASMAKTNLASKGVEILRASSKNINDVSEIMAKEFDKGIMKFMPKKIKETLGNIFTATVYNGDNAFFAIKSNKIVLPEKGLGLAAFHEIGHAMNANLSTFGKILQKMRGTVLLSLPILMISLLKTKKAEGEKPQGLLDKTTTFIKENAGKLTFATFLPLLAEEALATIKGNKLAKELVNNSALVKNVAKSNWLGFSTYLGSAALTALGVYLGTKVKDKIASPKLVNNTNTVNA